MIKSFRNFLFCILNLIPASLFSQVAEGDTALISLDEITITAARIPENARQFTRIVRVISRAEIESLPARDLADLLEYLPDIDVRQRGPGGVQSDISLRGGTFDQFAILINGINFSDPQTGHFQMDIPIPLVMIQRIEVLSGADVKSLGSNAFTGAINIVTGVPDGNSMKAMLAGGRHGFLDAGIGTRNRMGGWWQQSGVTWRKSNGYRENTDFNHLNGFLQTGYRSGRLDLSLMTGGLKKAFGANSFYTPKYPNQFEKTSTGVTALQVDLKGKLNIRQSVYYRLHTDVFSLFRTDPPSWYLSPNYHLSQTAGSKTDAWFESALGKTAVGFDFRQEWLWSTVLGEISSTARPIAGIAGLEYSRFGSRSHYSLSAEQQVVAGRFRLNGGLVLHQIREAKNHLQVYPSLDISYTPTGSFRTFISMNRAYRLPTFTELYYRSPTNQGNAALLPETAWHGEAGGEYRAGGFSARLNGFYRHAAQSIDWVRAGNESVWHTENLGQIVTYGIETGISLVPKTSRGILKILDRVDVGFRRYFQDHESGPYLSQYVLDYLKWKLTAGLNLKIGSSARMQASLVWQERNGTYTSFDIGQNLIELDYEPFLVADVKFSYRYRWATLIAECTNIFNRYYFDLGSIPQPGAWYKAGLEISLVGKK